MLNSVKDTLTSRAVLAYVNSRISRYGKVEQLKIDSGRKTVDLACQLDGERDLLQVRIEGYEIEILDGKKFLRVTRFTCPRPWLHHLLEDYGRNHSIELPAWAAAAL
jgi:hypothetical protein